MTTLATLERRPTIKEKPTYKMQLGHQMQPSNAKKPMRTFKPTNWTVDFVSPSLTAPTDRPRPAYLLRAEFDIPKDAQAITASVTAHGIYDLELDGNRVSTAEFAPGWSSYHHRLRYQQFDLTAIAEPGHHALAVWLADGWFRGRLGFNGGLWNNYGDHVAALVQIDVVLTDGTTQTIPLTWKYAPAPITAAGFYEGETYDATKEQTGWALPGFDDSSWAAPTILPLAEFGHQLEQPIGPDVEVIETMAPVKVEHRPNGRIRLDFGQNIAGKLVLKNVQAPKGHTLKLHHAEVLEHDELATRALRTADSIDTYIFNGSGLPVTWTPRFTYHGFRYAELEGWPAGAPDPTEAVVAQVVHSKMDRTGWFDSSHELLNKFHQNVVWSMRGNFVDVPTDCPQRDERLGWTGDIQVFGPTAMFLYDCAPFLRNWLRDVKAEQRQFGTVLSYHPWLQLNIPPVPAAAWGDVAVILPWTMYERTGDLTVLADHIDLMAAWVSTVDAATGGTGLWNSGFQFGDWLDPKAPPLNPADSRTDKYLVATAYHVHTADLLAKAYRALGQDKNADAAQQIADKARAAFQNEYVSPNGRLVSDTITAYSLAICFNLLPPALIPAAGDRLKTLVRESDHTITTGFVGTPLVLDALTKTGSVDTAYHLLLQTKSPSWLYPVTMGATTIWERWDSMLPDGSINAGEMTSFNHYALGAVADFMHRVVAGLAPGTPGYEVVDIAPQPGGGLTRASATHDLPAGRIAVAWQRSGDRFTLDITLPPGTSGVVRMPDGSAPFPFAAGTHQFSCAFRAASADPPIPPAIDFFNPDGAL